MLTRVLARIVFMLCVCTCELGEDSIISGIAILGSEQ